MGCKIAKLALRLNSVSCPQLALDGLLTVKMVSHTLTIRSPRVPRALEPIVSSSSLMQGYGGTALSLRALLSRACLQKRKKSTLMYSIVLKCTVLYWRIFRIPSLEPSSATLCQNYTILRSVSCGNPCKNSCNFKCRNKTIPMK